MIQIKLAEMLYIDRYAYTINMKIIKKIRYNKIQKKYDATPVEETHFFTLYNRSKIQQFMNQSDIVSVNQIK